MNSPFHDGEVRLQDAAGVMEKTRAFNAVVIRDHMPEQHRDFYPLLPFIVIGAVDDDGRPWATLRAGQPGFMWSPDPRALSVRLPPDADDPADEGLTEGRAIGLLGIELHTRRRNRLNGTVHRTPSGFVVAVEHAFGNCPKYIQIRHALPRPNAVRGAPEISDDLTVRARTIIAAADTFFVASFADLAHGRQVDVSHRGGRPGFVCIGDDGWLTVPDFSGNRMFNTLGNFAVTPKAGLVFFDDATGDLLQMTGRVELELSADAHAFNGAERFWRFRPERVVLRPGALALRLQADASGISPNNLRTGTWS
ncbi:MULTISPECIES: pyridoxamine 5'-phosphate oxidase family protein [Asticcacaulis]|uniref:pyridoxamine 5'-phosphate oxidase family protein n=1 Tax=Asticcacaulis TaxID=76890 RepID=UPI001AE5C0CD|nr:MULTISPECIES: pyridoxamine 5'-phosphate oxidase family protein [Asticcacaulis]MBP2158766.1 putative pyridoxine 5'-phosphate oxidase superfamily flavin-nucleotide-binding protein [Asticcacaulis solisilvae]MDR6799812.1 putative pyridoxine 5'-phosphate oxidase superfamily flavin-nucleotide-binding protein [Asticcacaulis sp. BE141]